jgi:hypothetical protein
MSLFEDLFEKQNRPRHNSNQEHVFGRQKEHRDNHRDRYYEHESYYSNNRDQENFSHIGSFARKLVNNKILLVLVGLVLVVLFGLFLTALTFAVPLVPKLLSYLDSNGLKSLMDQAMTVLGKILAVGGK